jgi:hypothetical protein
VLPSLFTARISECCGVASAVGGEATRRHRRGARASVARVTWLCDGEPKRHRLRQVRVVWTRPRPAFREFFAVLTMAELGRMPQEGDMTKFGVLGQVDRGEPDR